MSRDISYLLDILLYAREIRAFMVGIDRDAFMFDRKTQYAVIRCFEVMGEAVKRVSNDVRKRHPDIHWSSMAKMRDLLIHAYDRVDLDEVWDTVQNDIPDLIIALERIVPPEDKSSTLA